MAWLEVATVRPHGRRCSAPKRGGRVEATNSGIWQADAATPIAVWQVPLFRLAALRSLVARIPGPVLQGLLALAIYLAVFITAFALPLASHMAVPQLRAYWTDPNFYAWSLRWWPYAVSHGLNPLYSNEIGAPQGYNLAWATTTPTVDLLLWPVTAVFGVIVSYNVVLLTIPPISALAAFVAARRLTGRFWPALLAGAVYGFTPFEVIHDFQGQPNLTMIALFPLMVYLVLLWWDGTLGRVGYVIWMTVAMALEFYTFNEAFADMTAVWAGGLVIGFLVAGRAAWLKVLRLAGLTVIAYVAAIALALPYLIYALRHYAPTLLRQNNAYSLHLVRLVLPSSDKLFGLRPLLAYSNHIGRSALEDYVGLPLILVVLALAVFAWRRRIAWLLVIGFGFVIALAVGPNVVTGSRQVLVLPWAKLWSLPFARSAEPTRFVIFATLVLSIALAVWLAVPAGKTLGSRLLLVARWGLGLLAVAAVFADSPTSYQAVDPVPPGYHAPATMSPVDQLPAFITDGLYRQYLRPAETVVIITHRGNAAMLFQADADFYFRIDGGYINASLTPVDATPYQVEALNDPSPLHIRRFQTYVRTEGIGAIIVERSWAEPWMLTSFGKAGLHGTSVGGVIIYPISSGPSARAPSGTRTASGARPA
jgi:hypothetical protein